MQAVSFGDIIHFELSERDLLTCTDPQLELGPNNLIMQGVNLFKKRTGLSFSVKIHLEKNIPVGSGLGGGSSNLATTLWALNQYLERPYSSKELMEWSGELSSDAPFFFSLGTASVQGKGEIVKREPSLPNRRLWLACPHFFLSTPEVFQRCKVPSRGPSSDLLKTQLSSDFSYAVNDLEAAAFELCPKLKEVKKSLFKQGFDHVVMTGSGSAFYCLGEVNAPEVEGTAFFPVSFLERTEQSWYSSDYEKTTL